MLRKCKLLDLSSLSRHAVQGAVRTMLPGVAALAAAQEAAVQPELCWYILIDPVRDVGTVFCHGPGVD